MHHYLELENVIFMQIDGGRRGELQIKGLFEVNSLQFGLMLKAYFSTVCLEYKKIGKNKE